MCHYEKCFDELYKVFYLGTSNMDIGLIPLPMFTAGLFTNYNFDYSLINIFFIQFVSTALFSIFNYVKNKKELIICLDGSPISPRASAANALY